MFSCFKRNRRVNSIEANESNMSQNLTDTITINRLRYEKEKLIGHYNNIKTDYVNLAISFEELNEYITEKEEEYERIVNNIITENNRLNENMNKIANNKNINDVYLCIICLENIKDILFTPCNHLLVCNKCISKLGDNCPICRKEIEKKIKIYL